ncbi:MAG: TlyA family RNA methyltransferase [Actinomycetota bacterium]|nr:TlyA family RNA methyltransferase [Actinomycetota bacterium]
MSAASTGASGSRRLDVELVRRGLVRSRAQARELLDAGAVTVDGNVTHRPSAPVTDESRVELSQEPDHWVGRAAHKLLGALEVFGPGGLAVSGRRCLDVGASTGGFTQVLLERGATHVTALDVGHGQLVPLLAQDPRVSELSGTNIRDVHPGQLGAPYDLVVADLSFISVRLVLPSMVEQTAALGDLVLLVKPQFEVGRDNIGRTGVVGSTQERRRVLRDVVATAQGLGLHVRGLVRSPLRGGDGNREYLLWVTPRPEHEVAGGDLDALVELAETTETTETTEQAKGQP